MKPEDLEDYELEKYFKDMLRLALDIRKEWLKRNHELPEREFISAQGISWGNKEDPDIAKIGVAIIARGISKEQQDGAIKAMLKALDDYMGSIKGDPTVKG